MFAYSAIVVFGACVRMCLMQLLDGQCTHLIGVFPFRLLPISSTPISSTLSACFVVINDKTFKNHYVSYKSLNLNEERS